MKINIMQNKSLFFCFVYILMISAITNAQNIRINAYSAYVFDDKVDSYYDVNNYYNGTIKGGYQWGVGVEYMVHQSKGIELKYLRQDALAPMNYYDNGIQNKTFELGLNYILIGGSNYFHTGNDKIEPYAGLGLGMAIFSIKNPEPNTDSSKVKFAWQAKVGTNIWVAERVGIKLQVDLLSAVQSAGGGFYFGSGGSGAGISTYSSMYQWALGGGLTFKLGN